MITVTSINRHGYRIVTEHAYRSSAEFERRLRVEAGHGEVCESVSTAGGALKGSDTLLHRDEPTLLKVQ